MAIKLHGFDQSTCTQRVVTVLFEKNVSFEQVTIDITKAEQKSPEFLKLHPFGKIPVLEDDGFFVFESRAIAKYIAKKYAGQGTKLIPDEKNVKGYGKFEQACSMEQSYFDDPAFGITFEKFFKGMKGMGDADPAAVARHVANLDATLAAYDSILSMQKYLAGDEVTLADLFHLPYGKMARDLGYKNVFDKYTNVKRWWDELENRESWKKVTQK